MSSVEFRSWGGGRQRRVEATKSLSGARKRKASRRGGTNCSYRTWCAQVQDTRNVTIFKDHPSGVENTFMACKSGERVTQATKAVVQVRHKVRRNSWTPRNGSRPGLGVDMENGHSAHQSAVFVAIFMRVLPR